MVDIASEFGGVDVTRTVGRHLCERAVLDLALALERSRPWQLVEPGPPA